MNLIFGVFTALFSVVNPLGAVPVFLSLTQGDAPQLRNQQAQKACIYVVCILITFLLLGTYILNFFNITLEGMRIAGGLIIIRSGYNLMDGTYRKAKAISQKVEDEGVTKEDISFSPLAMPMLSGPGSISLLLSISSEANTYGEYFSICIAVLMLALVIYGIFRFSPMLFERLGQGGISAITRMMGFIVMTIGIQFIITGTSEVVSNMLAQ